MLTIDLMSPCFFILKVAGWLQILLISVDSTRGTIFPKRTKFSKFMHSLYVKFMIVKDIQLIHSMYRCFVEFKHEGELVNMVATGLMTLACLTSAIWNHDMHENMDELVLLFRTFEFKVTGERAITGQRKRRRRKNTKRTCGILLMYWKERARQKWWKTVRVFRESAEIAPKLSVRESLLAVSPFIVMILMPIFFLQNVFYPSWGFFALSYVSGSVQKAHPFLRYVGLVLETFAAFFPLFTMFSGFINELALQTCTLDRVTRMPDDVRSLGSMQGTRRMQIAKALCFELVCYHVISNLTNNLWRRMLYTGKIFAFLASAAGTFYVITRWEFSFISVAIFIFTFDVILIWLISIGRIYQFTFIWNDIKRELLHFLGSKCTPRSAQDFQNLAQLKARLKAIPSMGFSEGGFKTLQRQSALEFIDFYLNWVIGLLISLHRR